MLFRRSVSLLGGLALAAGLTATTAAAEGYPSMDERSGAYLGLRAVGGFTYLQDVEQKGSDPGNPTNDSHLDHTAGPALAAGYQFAVPGGGLQLEAEYTFRWRYDYEDARPVLDSAIMRTNDIGLSSNIQTHTGLVNLRYLMDFGGNLHPYIGAGLGLTHAEAESESTRLSPARTQLKDSETQTNLTWQASAGVHYDITRRVGLALGYRYVDMGSVNLGSFQHSVGGSIELEGDLISHDIMLGLLYRF